MGLCSVGGLSNQEPRPFACPTFHYSNDTVAYQEELGVNDFESKVTIERTRLSNRLVDPMHYFDEDGRATLEDSGHNAYIPQWQTSPYLQEGMVNSNLLHDYYSKDIGLHVWDSGTAVLGGYLSAPPGTTSHPDPMTSRLAALRSIQEGKEVPYLGDPMAYLYVPVFDVFGAKRKVVGVLAALIHWRSYFLGILPESTRGVIVVVEYDWYVVLTVLGKLCAFSLAFVSLCSSCFAH